MIEKKRGGGRKKKKKYIIFFFFFFLIKAIKFTESAAFCRVGRVTGNNNKFLLGLACCICEEIVMIMIVWWWMGQVRALFHKELQLIWFILIINMANCVNTKHN